MGINYGSHSTYKYGDAPYSLGITSALNKIMNFVPYGYIGSTERKILSLKPALYQSETFKYSFATSRSYIENINIFIVSEFESLSDSDLINSVEIYRGNVFITSTATKFRWIEELDDGRNILCELKTISFTNLKEDDLMSIYVNLKESNSSNAIVFSSSYMYDNALLNSQEYIQPFRYTPIVKENFLLPSFYVKDRLHIQSDKFIPNSSWSSGDGKSYVIASLPYGEILPSGESVVFTFYMGLTNVELTSNIDSDIVVLDKKKHTAKVKVVTYTYSGGTGEADFISYHKIKSDTFLEPQLLISQNQYVDSNTVNAFIDIANKKLYAEYKDEYFNYGGFTTIFFSQNGDGNFKLNNSPYDNTVEKYFYGGLSKYKVFTLWLSDRYT